MCNFSQTSPTGRHAFELGCTMQVGHGDSSHIGKGTLQKFDSNHFSVEDIAYDFDSLGYSGTLSFEFYSDNGESWTISVTNTLYDQSPSTYSFPGLTCSGDPGSELTYSGTYPDESDLSIIQKVSGKKLYFKHIDVTAMGAKDINVGAINTEDMELYFYNYDAVHGAALRVQGRVTDNKGAGLAGMRVEAWDKDFLTKHDALGFGMTKADGSFLIHLDNNAHKEFIFDKRPDVYFKVLKQKNEIHSTVKNPIKNVDTHQTVEIKLP